MEAIGFTKKHGILDSLFKVSPHYKYILLTLTLYYLNTDTTSIQNCWKMESITKQTKWQKENISFFKRKIYMLPNST